MDTPSPQHDANAGPALSLDGDGLARVRAADRTAELIITVGGLSVIAAVLGIIAYLAYVTLPLLTPGQASLAAAHAIGSQPFAMVLDEHGGVVAAVRPTGEVDVIDLTSGRELVQRPLLDAGETDIAPIDAISIDHASGLFIACRGASAVVGTIGFSSRSLGPASVPPAAEELEPGQRIADAGSVIQRIGEVQWRRTALGIERVAGVELKARVRLLDIAPARNGVRAAVVHDTGQVSVIIGRRSRGGLDDEGGLTISTLAVEESPGIGRIAGVRLLSDAGVLLVVDIAGRFARYTVGLRGVSIAEEGVLPLEGAEVTALGTVLGRQTVAIGTSSGRLQTFFLATDAKTPDDPGRLVPGRGFRFRDGAAVTAIRSSLRDRSLTVGAESGRAAVWHATSGKRVGTVEQAVPGAVGGLAVAPKLDAFVASSSNGLGVCALDVGHPEATMASVFLPVWYEGQTEPQYVYQASSAEDDAEPKLSLVPLIFGTLKATVFAMLFATPIAVLAAIYTSEFMSERLRRVIKPTIEMMASLPSVVLGFIAAMVVAPFIRDHLSTVLLAFVLAPVVVLVGAALWSLLPDARRSRVSAGAVMAITVVIGVAGIGAAVVASPIVEQRLVGPGPGELAAMSGLVEPAEAGGEGAFRFQGEWYRAVPASDEADMQRFAGMQAEFDRPGFSLKNWLGGVIGSPWPGWFALLTPLAASVFGVFGWAVALRTLPGLADQRWQPLARVLFSLAGGAALAAGLAAVLSAGGIDARESLLGAFTQRNTLVVGIIMGFAIIPIIYTISDDAMRSVPVSLKAASLGSGATPWQTVVRIVLPVAASGIFSAIMIGFGRAVGETMIVLMATGNTPVMEWNIFSGLRTLSANIAVELPEAERGGTHYRLLFLCGVVLFAMTFVINTSAELVRQHFRKRNAML